MNRFFIFVLTAALLGSGVTAAGSVHVIWAVNDGEKIERDDLHNSNKASNSAWDGHKVKIFGARNEIIAFQLIVETDDKGVAALSLVQPGGRPDGPARPHVLQRPPHSNLLR